MIHYHGTPIGGSRVDAARFLSGRHALVPFLYQQDLGIVAEVCQSFMFDNSAFTRWLNGERDNIAEWSGDYINWCFRWYKHPGFDRPLIPDVVDGSEGDNDALLADWPVEISGLPVWHLHESIGRLERLCHTYSAVALGSSGEWRTPGTKQWWQRMNEALSAICDDEGRPPCKLHGLRMLNTAIFTRLPLASADSTNAAQNNGATSRFGMYLPPTAAQRAEVIAERIEAHNSVAIWKGWSQDNLFDSELFNETRPEDEGLDGQSIRLP